MTDYIKRDAVIDYLDSNNMPWRDWVKDIPSADVVEVVRCKDCIHYDPPHIENHGERHEYKDMPKDAFDKLGTGLVHAGYGVNIGGRCTKNYNAGYDYDKRVFVSANSFCSYGKRAEE